MSTTTTEAGGLLERLEQLDDQITAVEGEYHASRKRVARAMRAGETHDAMGAEFASGRTLERLHHLYGKRREVSRRVDEVLLEAVGASKV